MRFRKSKKVDSHHTNPEYVCLIIEFLMSDSNVRLRYGKNGVLLDWLPTDDESKEYVKRMYAISPTFKKWIDETFGKKIIQIKL